MKQGYFYLLSEYWFLLAEQQRLVAYLDGLQGQMSALRATQAEMEFRRRRTFMPSVLD